MITFDPAISVQALQNVSPGSLVRWGENGEHVGICVISSGDPNGQKSLVQYNAATCRFEWQYEGSDTVVSYDGGLVVQPDQKSFSPSFSITADSSLYWLDGSQYVSVQVGNHIRFLDLNSGELQNRQSWPMVGGFRAWSAGVRGPDGKFVSLIAIGSPAAAATQP